MTCQHTHWNGTLLSFWEKKLEKKNAKGLEIILGEKNKSVGHQKKTSQMQFIILETFDEIFFYGWTHPLNARSQQTIMFPENRVATST